MATTEPSSTAGREEAILGSSLPHKYSFDEDSTSLSAADEEIPLDMSRLTMLLVSGKRQVFDFDPSTTVDVVKTYILNHWPQGKATKEKEEKQKRNQRKSISIPTNCSPYN